MQPFAGRLQDPNRINLRKAARGGGHVDRQAWDGVLADALVLQIAAEGIDHGRRLDHPSSACATTKAALKAQGDRLQHSVDDEAASLITQGVQSTDQRASTPAPLPTSLADCVAAHSSTGLHEALGLVWLHEWLSLAADRPRSMSD